MKDAAEKRLIGTLRNHYEVNAIVAGGEGSKAVFSVPVGACPNLYALLAKAREAAPVAGENAWLTRFAGFEGNWTGTLTREALAKALAGNDDKARTNGRFGPYLSALVKAGKVKMAIDDDGVPAYGLAEGVTGEAVRSTLEAANPEIDARIKAKKGTTAD